MTVDPVARDDLGDALLAPIVETVRAGVVWENYELIQENEEPGGVVHRILVRAVAVPDPGVAHFFGIMADVSEPGDVPWVTADVGERLQLLVEHSPDGIIVHQDGIIVYANPAAVHFVGLSSATEALGQPIRLVHPRRRHGPDRRRGWPSCTIPATWSRASRSACSVSTAR